MRRSVLTILRVVACTGGAASSGYFMHMKYEHLAHEWCDVARGCVRGLMMIFFHDAFDRCWACNETGAVASGGVLLCGRRLPVSQAVHCVTARTKRRRPKAGQRESAKGWRGSLDASLGFRTSGVVEAPRSVRKERRYGSQVKTLLC